MSYNIYDFALNFTSEIKGSDQGGGYPTPKVGTQFKGGTDSVGGAEYDVNISFIKDTIDKTPLESDKIKIIEDNIKLVIQNSTKINIMSMITILLFFEKLMIDYKINDNIKKDFIKLYDGYIVSSDSKDNPSQINTAVDFSKINEIISMDKQNTTLNESPSIGLNDISVKKELDQDDTTDINIFLLFGSILLNDKVTEFNKLKQKNEKIYALIEDSKSRSLNNIIQNILSFIETKTKIEIEQVVEDLSMIFKNKLNNKALIVKLVPLILKKLKDFKIDISKFNSEKITIDILNKLNINMKGGAEVEDDKVGNLFMDMFSLITSLSILILCLIYLTTKV